MLSIFCAGVATELTLVSLAMGRYGLVGDKSAAGEEVSDTLLGEGDMDDDEEETSVRPN